MAPISITKKEVVADLKRALKSNEPVSQAAAASIDRYLSSKVDRVDPKPYRDMFVPVRYVRDKAAGVKRKLGSEGQRQLVDARLSAFLKERKVPRCPFGDSVQTARSIEFGRKRDEDLALRLAEFDSRRAAPGQGREESLTLMDYTAATSIPAPTFDAGSFACFASF